MNAAVTLEDFCYDARITVEDGLQLFVHHHNKDLPYIGEDLHRPPYNFWVNETTAPNQIRMPSEVVSECRKRLAMTPFHLRETLARRYEDQEISRNKRVGLIPYLGREITIVGHITGKKPLKYRDNWLSVCLAPIELDTTGETISDHQWFDIDATNFNSLQLGYGDTLYVHGLVREYQRFDRNSSFTDYGVRADFISDDTENWLEIVRTYNHKNGIRK